MLPQTLALSCTALQVVTAKSSEVNLLVLAANPEAEHVAEHLIDVALNENVGLIVHRPTGGDGYKKKREFWTLRQLQTLCNTVACCLQVVTAKSSEVNLLVLAANPEAEDVAEHAVPEQFISTFVNGKLITTAASHGGG
jgi:hypothetical protein